MRVTGKGSGIDRAESRGVGRTESGGVQERRKQGSDSGEKIAISQRGKDTVRAKEIAKNTPDIDEAKVARLKAQIQNGSYKPDAEKVASRLVDEHLNTML